MAVYSANGNFFSSLFSGRVRYTMEYDDIGDLYRLPKAPELIIACHNAAPDVFFNSATDYSPVWFDSSGLAYSYGDQIFFDVGKNKNFVVLSQAVVGDCLDEMNRFVASVFLLFFDTNKSGTFSPTLVPSAGTHEWDYGDGSPTEITNTPSHIYSDGTTKMVCVNANTSSLALGNTRFNGQSIIGSLDFSKFTSMSGALDVSSNASMTSLLLSPTNSFIIFRVNDTGIGPLNLQNFSISGTGEFSAFNITNCTSIIFPDTPGTFGSICYVYNTGLTGTIDFKGAVFNNTNFLLYSNSSLTGIDLSGCSGSITNFQCQNSDITGTLNTSAVNTSGIFLCQNNPNLTGLTITSTTANYNSFRFYNCGINTTVNLTSVTCTLRMQGYGNSNMTTVTWGSYTTGLTEISFNDCALNLTTVDGLFSSLDSFFTSGGANDPIKNLSVDVSGGTNAIPTGGASNANILSLTTKFTNAGYLFSATINT